MCLNMVWVPVPNSQSQIETGEVLGTITVAITSSVISVVRSRVRTSRWEISTDAYRYAISEDCRL
jgi:hypothetical protein